MSVHLIKNPAAGLRIKKLQRTKRTAQIEEVQPSDDGLLLDDGLILKDEQLTACQPISSLDRHLQADNGFAGNCTMCPGIEHPEAIEAFV